MHTGLQAQLDEASVGFGTYLLVLLVHRLYLHLLVHKKNSNKSYQRNTDRMEMHEPAVCSMTEGRLTDGR